MSKSARLQKRKAVKVQPTLAFLETRAMAGDLFHSSMVLSLHDFPALVKPGGRDIGSEISTLAGGRATSGQSAGGSSPSIARADFAGGAKGDAGASSGLASRSGRPTADADVTRPAHDDTAKEDSSLLFGALEPHDSVANLQAPIAARQTTSTSVGGGQGSISNMHGGTTAAPATSRPAPAAQGGVDSSNDSSTQPPSLPLSLGTTPSTPAPAHAFVPATAPAGGSAHPFYQVVPISPFEGVQPGAAQADVTYSPTQISEAYGLNLLSQTGSGETIYIVDAYNDPNIASDLKTFDAGYESGWSLPAINLTVHEMSSKVANNSSWGVEESLDVEWAHAIAPQANIVLVEATSSSNTNLFAAVNWATSQGAGIVSMSWGGTDASSDTSYNTDFEHSGVTYIASAGDTASDLEYPAASPYVLSIGGTTLNLNSNGSYSSESAWADGGGGISKYEALPAYQSGFGISNSGRSIPDVAWDANPDTGVEVYDSYLPKSEAGWIGVGGTSVGAPSWAGVTALADQGRSTPLTTDSLTTRAQYDAAEGSLYATNYHDVTTGSNGHAAGVGYDLATGIGSPQANDLVPWLKSNT
jgi:hypothetical protein